MQRQQQVIDQHLASLSEQDRQQFNQLSFVENYHYLAQHNLLEHDTESESELCFSDSESDSEDSESDSENSESTDFEDYLRDLQRSHPNTKSETEGRNPYSLVSDTKSESELSKGTVPLDAKVVCARPKAADDANKVCKIFNIHC